MIVCLCHAVSDRQIQRCVAGGAGSPGAVSRACGAGTGCGGCVPTVRALIDEARFDEARMAGVTAQHDGGQVSVAALRSSANR